MSRVLTLDQAAVGETSDVVLTRNWPLQRADERLPHDLTGDGRSILHLVCSVLDALKLKYEVLPTEVGVAEGQDADDRFIYYGLQCDCGMCKYLVVTNDTEKKLLIYLKSPTLIPTALRTNAALYLMYINNMIALGSFELDFEDGEVRFKISSMGTNLSEDVVKYMTQLSMAMMDRFFPGLMAVVYGKVEPSQAYQTCASWEERKDV
jgi:hypothetical protein